MSDKHPQKHSIADYLLGLKKIKLSPNFAKWVTRFRRFKEDQINTVGGRLPRLLRQSPIVRLFTAMQRVLLSTKSNVYGAMLLAFGLFTFLSNYVVFFLRGFEDSPTFALLVGAVSSLLAIPLLTSSSPVGSLFRKSEAVYRFLFDFFCFRHAERTGSEKGVPLFAAIGLGIALGALGFFLPLSAVLLSLLVAVYLCLAASSPEFSFLLVFLLTPLFVYLPNATYYLAASVFVTFLSYLGKALCGKRLLRISLYDKILFWVAAMFLVGGLLQKGSYSFLSAILLCVILLGHLLASNLFINPNICRSAIVLFLCSSVPTAVFGIVEYLIKISRGQVFPEEFDSFFLPKFAEATGGARADAFFPSPDLFAVYLAVSVILSFAIIRKNGRTDAPTLLYYIPFLLSLGALLCTVSHETWFALLLAYVAYRIFLSRKGKKQAALLLFALPIALLLLPANVFRSLSELSAFSWVNFAPILRVKEASAAVLSDLQDGFFFGIGRMNFAEDFPADCAGILSLVKAEGILATLSIVFLLVVRLYHMQRYARFVLASSVRTDVLLSSVAVFTLCLLTLSFSLFSESILFYLFCTFLGMGNATLRLSREEMYEKSFYDLENSDDTAEVEIPVAEDA